MPLIGVAQLDKQLAGLSTAASGRALRAAVRAAGAVVRKEARGRIPVGDDPHRTYKKRLVAPGFAKRNLQIKVSLSKNKQRATAKVGVRSEAFYAVQFVELGVASRGIPARPWLVPAFNATKGAQQQALAEKLRAAILKEVRKTQ